jgi:hypothetical protein
VDVNVALAETIDLLTLSPVRPPETNRAHLSRASFRQAAEETLTGRRPAATRKAIDLVGDLTRAQAVGRLRRELERVRARPAPRRKAGR